MDREKIISKFVNYLSRVGAYRKDCSKGCDACMPLHPDDGYCDIQLLDNVFALLQEKETVEPKQGEWIYCEDVSGQDGYKCSECGFFEPWYYDYENHNFITDYAYCPSCGKSMQEGR